MAVEARAGWEEAIQSLPGCQEKGLSGCQKRPICGVGALARRCDVRTNYASHLASRAALHLDLFEQPGQKRVLSTLLGDRKSAGKRGEQEFVEGDATEFRLPSG